MKTVETHSRLRVIAIVAVTSLLVSHAFAQVTTTGIRGLVRDPSGAIVPNVVLDLKDNATGILKATKSGEDGSFTFASLQAGTYELTASAVGFQTAVYNSISVDSGRTTDLNVEMRIGAAMQSVEVSAMAVQLQTTSNEVGTTIANNSIRNLPYASRDTLNFALLIPGAQSANSDRNSTFNGLPNAALNISVDGMNNNSQRFKSGGTSFFQFAPSRVDAIEQVTVSTSGVGADASGEGAMSVRFTTRRGTNQYHFQVFEQFQNEDLNANSYFNNLRGIVRPRVRQNNPGGSFSGPLVPFVPRLKNRLFFFAYFEAQPQPGTANTTNNIPTLAAQRGDYTYLGTDNALHTVNLLNVASANGYTGTIDPTIQGIFDQINKSKTAVPTTFEPVSGAPFMERMLWNRSTSNNTLYPTARVDYQFTDKLAWHGTWNLRYNNTAGRATYPGTVAEYRDAYKITTYVASNSVDWTISPNLVNTATFGVQSNLEYFYNPSDIRQWAPYGNRRIVVPNLNNTFEPVIFDQTPFDRNNPVFQWTDNLTWVRNKHTFTLGGSLLHTTFYETSYNNAGVLSYNIGLATGDPVGTALRNGLPNINTSNNDLANAQQLYALLTGRLSGISGSLNVDEKSHQYAQFAGLTQRFAFNTGALYAQDSYRITPHLTLNYGLRWQFDSAIHNTNGIDSLPAPGSFFGPSTGLFQPGILNGNLNPTFVQANYGYGKDFLNPAPNFGFAWNPAPAGGLLQKLLGDKKTVISGSYGITFYNDGMNSISNVMSGNRGTTQSVSATAGSQFELGTLELRSPVPPFAVNPSSFSFPIAMSNYVLNGGTSANTVDPNLRSPYVQNWNFRMQRELSRNLILEARYVGNKSTHLWHYQNYQEVNTFENGFLPQFIQAQKNLAINQAAGRGTTFENLGLAGQAAIPIFEAAFGANGTQPALAAASGFQSSGFITNLQQGAAGALANSLASTTAPTYFCRLVGANFAPCAAQGYTASHPYPINFFKPNPFATNLNYQRSDANSNYNGLQIELRRAFDRGLMFDAGYTWSHALGTLYNRDDQTSTDQWQTLRNGHLDYGPIPFDRRHTFFTYWTYDLPAGRNKLLNTTNPVLERLVGGWTIGGIQKISSGVPTLLTSRTDPATASTGRQTFNNFADGGVLLGNGLSLDDLRDRLNTITSGYIASCQCFKTAVSDIIQANGQPNASFIAPGSTPGVIGPRLFLYGKTQFQLDMSLTKETRIKERLSLRFQAQVLNFLNHPFLSQGSSNITATTFGNVTSVQPSPTDGKRTIQLRAYLNF